MASLKRPAIMAIVGGPNGQLIIMLGKKSAVRKKRDLYCLIYFLTSNSLSCLEGPEK
jgi:hypothetical protein